MDHKTKVELLNAGELAQFLRVSLATVRLWTMRGDLPAVKLGRRVLYRRDRIEAWVRTRETCRRARQ
jgi:excisionase family DNA binding protein